MKYVYTLKFERIGVDDNGNLFEIKDKPTLQAQVMLLPPEIQLMHKEIVDNLDADLFEKLAKEIKYKIPMYK